MSGEGVIDETNFLCPRILGDLSGHSDASNPPRIDLHETQSRIVDHVLCLMEIVAALTARQFYAPTDASQFAIGFQRAGDEWLLQPQHPARLKRSKPLRSLGDIVLPSGAGVDEQEDAGPKALPGRLQLIRIVLDTAASVRTPAEFGGSIACGGNLLSFAKGALGIIAKELRGVGDFRARPSATEQPINRLAQLLPQEVPACDPLEGGQNC